jgi:hypothetical protein
LFLLLLFQCPEFIEKNTAYIEEQVEKRMKQEKNDQDKAAKSSMKRLVSEINSHYKSVAPLILKGCSISCESFEKIRQITSFDLKQDFAVVPRCQLPKIALGSFNAMYVKEKEEIFCISHSQGVLLLTQY